MKQEISVAATFLASLLSSNSAQDLQDPLACLNQQQLFSAALQQALFVKLLDHWHPSLPEQGQAYRAICINHKPGILLAFSLLILDVWLPEYLSVTDCAAPLSCALLLTSFIP
jgi:hypothetical protein